METNGSGITRQERDRLTGQHENATEMDMKASLLAFAGLLLVCALIVAASLIARSRVEPAEPAGSAPLRATAEETIGPEIPSPFETQSEKRAVGPSLDPDEQTSQNDPLQNDSLPGD